MRDIKEHDVGFEAMDLSPDLAPPLRLAGIDEDDIAEPQLVRGID